MGRKPNPPDHITYKPGLYVKFNCYPVRLVEYHYEVVNGKKTRFARVHFVNHPSFDDSLLDLEVGSVLHQFMEGYKIFIRRNKEYKKRQ